jgi:hypothetical protein
LKNVDYFMVIWNIVKPFGIFYGSLVILWSFGVFSPRFGILYKEKSGNPEKTERCLRRKNIKVRMQTGLAVMRAGVCGFEPPTWRDGGRSLGEILLI